MNPKTQKLIDEIQLERERIELGIAKARLDQIRLDNALTQRRMDCASPSLPKPDLRPAEVFWAALGLPEQLRPQFRISEEDVLAFRASQKAGVD